VLAFFQNSAQALEPWAFLAYLIVSRRVPRFAPLTLTFGFLGARVHGWCGRTSKGKTMKILQGHHSPETAYVVPDYPYGYTPRFNIRYSPRRLTRQMGPSDGILGRR
jgi:hypothetical protein